MASTPSHTACGHIETASLEPVCTCFNVTYKGCVITFANLTQKDLTPMFCALNCRQAAEDKKGNCLFVCVGMLLRCVVVQDI